jgi:hypothetical protein
MLNFCVFFMPLPTRLEWERCTGYTKESARVNRHEIFLGHANTAPHFFYNRTSLVGKTDSYPISTSEPYGDGSEMALVPSMGLS